ADIGKAADLAAKAAFRNQGQICLAGSRLIVERSVADQVVGRILERVEEIRLGDPLSEDTTMGSLISKEHRDRVAGYVDLARQTSGAEILCGGRIPPDHHRGAYYQPTVITGLH